MRTIIAVLAVLGAVLAGCSTPTDPVPDVLDPVTLDPAAYVIPAVPKVDATALLSDHATFVAGHNERANNLPTHESSRIALMEYFESYGLTAVRFNFTNEIDQANILGIKWGVDRQNWVFVGAHYDTTDQQCAFVGPVVPDNPATGECPLRRFSQGAYDDGSGTMMTVHLAKAFANVTPYYTIAFTLFDGEERGTQGAAAMVDAILAGDFEVDGIKPTIVADLDLDMIGLNWPGVNAPINLVSNSRAASDHVLATAKEMGFPEGQVIEKDGLTLGSSDYARFWEVSEPQPIPTVFFISNFEETGAPAPAPDQAHTPTPAGYYAFWHVQDTVETMTAAAGGYDNLRAGFQSASDLAASVTHLMACQPLVKLDAVAK